MSTEESLIGKAVVGFFTVVLGAIIVMALFLYLALASSYALQYLWAWFILPVFPSLPALSLWQAFGISLTVGYLTSTDLSFVKKEEDKGKKYWAFFNLLLRPWFVLLSAYLIHILFF